MIALETNGERGDWPQKLAAPMSASAIRWRQDGKPTQKEGKWTCRVVAYVDADVVRERLDEVVPGEWDLTLEVLPAYTTHDTDGKATGTMFCVKAKLQILGVIRENIGQSDKDPKAAATDAFKRAAARFGIGHELGTPPFKSVWVQVVDGSKYAKLVDDPNKVVGENKRRWALRVARGEQVEAKKSESGSSGANGGGAQAPARQPGASPGRSSPGASPARPASANPREQYYEHKNEVPF